MQRGLPVLGFMVLLLRWQRGCILVQVIKPFDNAEKLRRPFFTMLHGKFQLPFSHK